MTRIWPVCLLITLAASTSFAADPTFNRDVLPILQENCQACHRPGEIGPMSLLTYQSTRPWAKAIKEAVVARKMPPWFADPQYGHFSNDRTLKQSDIATLAAWADAGAPEGDAKDKPAPVQWVEGWSIGQPDQVIEMPAAYDVPAKGTVEYTYIIVPSGFKVDRWIRAAEVRPGERSVAHHINIHIRRPDSKWLRQYPVGVPFVPSEQKTNSSAGGGLIDEVLTGYLPGRQQIVLPSDEAKLVAAGSDFVFQMHYTTNGKAVSDRTKLGLIFADKPPARRVARIGVTNNSFVIPPGASDHRVDAAVTLQSDVEVVSFRPHMHVRGKWMEIRAVYPSGQTETLLRVPRYDFNWQMDFMPAGGKRLPEGTRLEVSAGFDNSANNRDNPDPTAEVRWGDQSWEEMMIGFVEVAFNPALDIPNVVGGQPTAKPVVERPR